jgi:transposase
MQLYPARALERAMKVKEVITRAMSGQINWMQAAEILGMSDRQLRRWRGRWAKHGYDGLFDRRTQRPSPKRGDQRAWPEAVAPEIDAQAGCIDPGRDREPGAADEAAR